MTIPRSDARYLALKSQMLLNDHSAETKKDLLKIIEHLGYIQIDTISIVRRAHEHILWTRFPSYDNKLLDALIDKDKKVFEYWAHAASYLPMRDYRYSLLRKEAYKIRYKAWAKKNAKLLQFILDRITAEGPLQSKDFEATTKRGTWWDWKLEKEALEFLFHSGELMVKARKSFQKVYDLPERILPANVSTAVPAQEEFTEHLIMGTIKANGLSSQKEITYLRGGAHGASAKKVLNRLVEDKKIVRVSIESDKDNEIYYTTGKILRTLNKRREPDQLHILSPFDNFVIQRKRIKTLFNFDYTIECYVPAPKRKYGYYCLPIIYGDKFIGRLDAKADRAENTLKIINLFYEDKVKMNKKITALLKKKVTQLAKFSGCEKTAFINGPQAF